MYFGPACKLCAHRAHIDYRTALGKCLEIWNDVPGACCRFILSQSSQPFRNAKSVIAFGPCPTDVAERRIGAIFKLADKDDFVEAAGICTEEVWPRNCNPTHMPRDKGSITDHHEPPKRPQRCVSVIGRKSWPAAHVRPPYDGALPIICPLAEGHSRRETAGRPLCLRSRFQRGVQPVCKTRHAIVR